MIESRMPRAISGAVSVFRDLFLVSASDMVQNSPVSRLAENTYLRIGVERDTAAK
jgi:hypothetical protein